MKILFLSSLYRSPHLPERSAGNARIVGKMRRHAYVRVVVPLPWYPPLVAEKIPAWARMRAAPALERDVDGEPIVHLRHAHVPGAARALYASLYGISLWPALRREIERYRPDAILSAWAYPDGTAAAALGRALGVPTLMRVMGSDINEVAKLPLRRQQIAWALRHLDGTIAVSTQLARACVELGAPKHKVHFVPTGVDPEKFHPVDRVEARRELGIDADERVIVAPARLSPEKGVHFLVEALARLERHAPGRHRAVLVGSGSEEGALRELAAKLGVSERVSFAGWQDELRMKIYYAAADVATLPSLSEGWPDALMEALACGCPVVASTVGGMPDIVALGGAGELFEPGDVPALTDALAKVLDTRWDRGAIAKRLAPYDLASTGRRYVELCAEAAGLPPP